MVESASRGGLGLFYFQSFFVVVVVVSVVFLRFHQPSPILLHTLTVDPIRAEHGL